MPLLIEAVMAFLPLLTVQAYASPLMNAAAPSCSYIPVQPPPAGLVCNEKGTMANPSISSTTNVASIASCANNCLKASATTCVGFSYGPGKKCIQYNKPFAGAGQGYKASSTSQMTFSNRRCYKQSCTCPVASQQICSGSCIDTSSDPANCGACGQAVQMGNTCCNSHSVNTMTDKNNCGSCGATISSTSNACCGGSGVDTLTDKNNCGGCGKQCSGNQLCTQGACKTPCGPGPGPQLLQNPGFDNCDPNNYDADPPWNVSNGQVQFDYDPSFTQAGSCYALETVPSNGPYNVSIYQDVQGLVAGHSYTIAAYYQPVAIYPDEGDPNGHCTITISFANQTITSKDFTSKDSPSPWIQFVDDNVSYSGTSSTARLELAFSCPKSYIGRGIANMQFDTISVTDNQNCPA